MPMQRKQAMKNFITTCGLGLALALGAGAASAQQPYVNATVGGVLSPGVYGRIEIGNAPPPPLIYTQPVVIRQPAVQVVHQAPVYMYVPPGHAKNWSKHCARYNACGVPVYFVRMEGGGPPGHEKHKHKDKGHGHGRGHGDRD